MRQNLPLLRSSVAPASRDPILRYGVAVLSTTLALIPALLFSDISESRLAVFAVAVMVSAWYGGWKPGLVATSFALTVSAYYSLAGPHTPTEYRQAVIRLALFVTIAILICWFNGALRAAQEGLRRSESNFRSLVTNAPYGICRCDSLGHLVDVNPALVTSLGYSSAQELVGRNLSTLYADGQQWFLLADYLRNHTEFQGLDCEWTRKDGSTTAVRLSGRAIIDEKKNISFEIFTEDVTERRALEEQLRQSQKMEAIGRLAGGVAHDFNNLLTVIIGLQRNFCWSGCGPIRAARAEPKRSATAAERAAALTRQLLAFSRKQVLAPKVLDLNAVVAEWTEDADAADRRGHRAGHRSRRRSSGAVKADPGQIEQVMHEPGGQRARRHAAGRAAHASRPRNVELDEAYARMHVAGAARATTSCWPSATPACGMDAETQSHIFEPFFTTKEVGKGTGLGLATVYGIVKQSGGYIWVYSEPGDGTTFKIYLPRVDATDESPVEQPASRRSAPTSRGAETVLVVEDEAESRRLARQSWRTQRLHRAGSRRWRRTRCRSA